MSTALPKPNKPAVIIAIDAMGGDFAPSEVVKGSVEAARRFGIGLLLVGQQSAIEQELAQCNTQDIWYEIVHTDETIDMGEHPATAIRKKKNASIVLTARCVKEGRAAGMVACGSTGAAMASALFQIGRLPGIDRPAIGVQLPTTGDTPCLLIDSGANADCTPEMLRQFAHMGYVFMRAVYHQPQPRVGILNIGSEPGKGSVFVNEAYNLLESDATLPFLGNAEGRDMFLGRFDVVVTDGFTGNVALKSVEGMVSLLLGYIKQCFQANLWTKLVGFLALPVLRQAKKKVHPDELGGALLFGINGICVIAHGASKSYAVQNAIRVAHTAIVQDVLGQTSAAMAQHQQAKTTVPDCPLPLQ